MMDPYDDPPPPWDQNPGGHGFGHGHEQEEEVEDPNALTCPICLGAITGTQMHMSEVSYCAKGLHAFHSECIGKWTKNECPMKCGPMTGPVPDVQQGYGQHGEYGYGQAVDNNAYGQQAQHAVAVAQYNGVNIVPTGTNDTTQAVVTNATVTAQGNDYQVVGGAVNAAAANTEYDILLADGTVLAQGVTVLADGGGGNYTFGWVWVDIPL